MKKVIAFIIISFFSKSLLAQNNRADSLLSEMAKAKADTSRVGLMNEILYKTNSLSQQDRIDYSKKILDLAKKQNDKILESIITAELGYILAINGNKLQGSELAFNALEIAEKHQNKLALGIIYQDLAICFRDDKTKYKEFLFKALPNSEAAGDYSNLTAIQSNISKLYSSDQNKDSALYYAQRSYEITLSKNIEENLAYCLIQLAKVNYYYFQNKVIAFEYMRKALNAKFDNENADHYVNITTNLARLFENEGQHDSALFYTNKAVTRLNNARFVASLDVYDLYKKIYLKTNSDSALKYYRIYETVKDSIDKMSDVQQQQLLSIKKEIELGKTEEERNQNIQFALIAFGIVSFIILYLLLSRSFITNTKLIEFFGVMALLIVFEFLNLLLHPFLESVTNHTPLLMLLALVCIAALLVPAHHVLEKWTTKKLVEKNKKVRLTNAKKTIQLLSDEKLEK